MANDNFAICFTERGKLIILILEDIIFLLFNNRDQEQREYKKLNQPKLKPHYSL